MSLFQMSQVIRHNKPFSSSHRKCHPSDRGCPTHLGFFVHWWLAIYAQPRPVSHTEARHTQSLCNWRLGAAYFTQISALLRASIGLSSDIVDRVAPSDGQATCEVPDCFRPKNNYSRNFRSWIWLAYSGGCHLVRQLFTLFLLVHVETQAGQRQLKAWRILRYLGRSRSASGDIKV